MYVCMRIHICLYVQEKVEIYVRMYVQITRLYTWVFITCYNQRKVILPSPSLQPAGHTQDHICTWELGDSGCIGPAHHTPFHLSLASFRILHPALHFLLCARQTDDTYRLHSSWCFLCHLLCHCFATGNLKTLNNLSIQIMPGKGDVPLKLAVTQLQNVMQSNTPNRSNLFTQWNWWQNLTSFNAIKMQCMLPRH